MTQTNRPPPAAAPQPSAATKADPNITSSANDFYLFTSTRAALDAGDKVRNANVIVAIRNSIVTLTGTVTDAAQKAAAEQSVRGVQGVKGVRNEIRISPSAARP